MRNDYEIRGKITIIFLVRKDDEIVESLISTQDLEFLLSINCRWYAKDVGGKTYVYGNMGSKKLILHRVLMGNPPRGYVCDHINHNGLINTRDNLRVLTVAENIQHRKSCNSNSKSKILGVHFLENSKRKKKWVVDFRVGSTRVVKYFSTEEEAEQKYIELKESHAPHTKTSQREMLI